MASIVGKRVNGQTYYYLARSGRVGGRPRIVEQEYLGDAESVAEAVRSSGDVSRVRQRPYGDLVAVFGTLRALDVAGVVDSLVGRQRAAVSVGQCLELAVAHRLLARTGESVAAWWEEAAVRRHLRLRAVPPASRLARAVAALPRAAVEAAVGSRARDVLGSSDGRTLFVHDLCVTLDGAVPVSGVDGTVLLESGALGHPTRSFVGALPITDYPELLAVRPRQRSVVDATRFPGVTAFDTRALVAGVDRRVIVVHSANAAAAQTATLEAELTVVARRLERLAELLESGTIRVGREKAATDIARITRVRWVDRVVKTALTSDSLTWSVDEAARRRLTDEVFGKQLLITDHADWSVADVLTAYRARFRLESTLRTFAEPRDAVGVLAVTVAHLMRHRAHQAGLDLSVQELLSTLAGITETELVSPSTGGRPRVRRMLNELTPFQQVLLEIYN
ncbi:DNA ligase-like domain-containing protein [Tenggerimyces flavus]|uniref:Transposase n=1 Tax=Tenggerimyces flavus TaxID=1708749 RepID=A0ABV7YGD8_9ACTN|nr:transposase [Tenggerimyces flavus]MBM7784201.1 hypothetical protein [Tenggerimyces flavus]